MFFAKKKIYTEMLVTLKDEKNSSVTLTYDIYPNLSAQIWANTIRKAQPLWGGLRERDRFNNFPEHPGSNLELLLGSLKATLDKLKPLHPELNFPEIDRANLQTSINDLHYHFAHGHHVTDAIKDHNRELWTHFNMMLHTIEERIRAPKSDAANPFIIFTWHDPKREPIPDECFVDFRFGMEFGVAYSQYVQIGRHFPEMFYADDDRLADEHIEPHEFIGADTLLWFGRSSPKDWEERTMKQLEQWFLARRERFEALGFFWGDPKLALGQIPVAKLKDVNQDRQSLVSQLSEFRRVDEVSVR